MGLAGRTDGELFCRRLCRSFIDIGCFTRAAIVLADATQSVAATSTCSGTEPAAAGGIPLIAPVVSIDLQRPPTESALAVTAVTPLCAGGRWLGVVFANRGGEPFVLTAAEQQVVANVARMLSIAVGAWLAMCRRTDALLAQERVQLAHEIHDRVVQDLFGASVMLGAPSRLSGDERATCEASLSRALGELDRILRARVAAGDYAPECDETIDLRPLRRRYSDLPVSWRWDAPATLPSSSAALVLEFIDEALRNVRKHALSRSVEVVARETAACMTVEVTNDGRGDGAEPRRLDGRSGLGLRLLKARARQHGAAVETALLPDGRWCASLRLRGRA